jgi:hypothetical protein
MRFKNLQSATSPLCFQIHLPLREVREIEFYQILGIIPKASKESGKQVQVAYWDLVLMQFQKRRSALAGGISIMDVTDL